MRLPEDGARHHPMKLIRGIVVALTLIGAVIVTSLMAAVFILVAAAFGGVLSEAFFDTPTPGAIVGALVVIAHLVKLSHHPTVTHLRHAIPRAIRSAVLQRDEYCCQRCGSTKHLQIDHIRPVALGGDNDIHNLQVLCAHCNESKGARYIG